MPDKVKVFLSYRRADTQHVAGRAGDRLSEMFDLFMDIDTIPPGVDFTDYVRRAVGSCDVLLAFIGDQWVKLTDEQGRRRIDDPNDFVAEEIQVALTRDVRVIPVLVEGATLPLPEQLPERLRPLINRQSLPLRHSSFSADMTRLIAGIEHAGAHRSGAASTDDVRYPVRSTPPTNDEFAERWESEARPPTPPVVPIRIPARRTWHRPVIVGVAVLLVATLAGVVWRVARPEGGDPTSTTSTPAEGTTAGSTTPSPTRTIKPAATLRQLNARIPHAIRQTCEDFVPTSTALRASLLIAAQCVPAPDDSGRTPVYSFYFSYASTEAATTAYRSYYAPKSLPSGNCTSEPAEMPYRRGSISGTLRCYEDSAGYRVFAWTADELSMVVSAADQDMSYAEMLLWYTHAGPLA